MSGGSVERNEPAGSAQPGRLSPLLIVEDHVSQPRTLTNIMEAEGFEVEGCASATQALEYCRRKEPGVMIVDLSMPDLSGIELLGTIRQISPDLPVIINTGYGSLDSAKEAIGGADEPIP